MTETEQKLVRQIIKLEDKISQCLDNDSNPNGKILESQYMKMLRQQVRYCTQLLLEGKEPKHPLE